MIVDFYSSELSLINKLITCTPMLGSFIAHFHREICGVVEGIELPSISPYYHTADNGGEMYEMNAVKHPKTFPMCVLFLKGVIWNFK